MNKFESTTKRRLVIAVALFVAGALGYAVAKWTAGSTAGASTAAKPANAAAANTLRMPESYLATMGIELETVTPGNLSAEIQAPATVVAASNGQAMISSQVAGTLRRMYKRLGDTVKAGEVLALVDSRDAAALAAERTVTESKAELARSMLKREQSLFDQRVTPRQDLEAAVAQAAAAEAEAARARSVALAAHVAGDGHSVAVVSPIAGRVTSANVTLGAFVEPNTELYRVADPRFVLIEAAVTAADAVRVSAGDVATVMTASGKTLAASVQSVTPTVNEQTRSATVVLRLTGKAAALTPGELVQAHIASKASGTAGFVAPDEAVQFVNGGDTVFVRTPEGFRLQPVQVGARAAGRVLVLSGLRAGQVIATRNAFLLKAELNKSVEEDE